MNPALKSIAESSQRCKVSSLYRIWLAYAAGLIIFAILRHWIVLLLWVCAVPLGKWLQVRHYRYFSAWFGYGKLEEDRQPPSPVRVPRPTPVTYYRALGCPFCPIVGERLRVLQKQMGFDLRVVDVTLHPHLLAKLGVRSVPVVDVNERRLVGNATSQQLAELIAPTQPMGVAG